MSFHLPSFIAIVLAYLLGSLSFAVIVSRSLGMADPRSYGSKNPGATNVLRSGRKGAALATLLLDALKGWLPVFVVHQVGERFGLGPGTAALAGLAAFLGHLYPVFFGFKGGKGVATAAGALVGTLAPTLNADAWDGGRRARGGALVGLAVGESVDIALPRGSMHLRVEKIELA